MGFLRLMAALVAAVALTLSAVLLVFFRDSQIRIQGWVLLAISAVLFVSLFWKRWRKGKTQKAQLLFDTGRAAYDKCHLGEAAKSLSQAAAFFEECQDWEGQALSLMELGNCEHEAGRFDAAIEALFHALQLWEIIPEEQRQDNVWRLMSNLASSFAAKNELDTAENYARRALHQCELRYQDGPELAQCKLILAGVCRKLGNCEEAGTLIHAAQEFYKKTNDRNAWQGFLEVARLYDDQDQFEQAGACYKLTCELLVKQVGVKHLEVCRAMEAHAAMLARAGHNNDSAMLQARAAGILDTIH